MDFLEMNDIHAEIKGCMTPGRLKMTDQSIIFKNSKTGKIEQVNAADMDFVNFQRFVGTYGIRIFMKNGTLHRYSGFKEGDQEKIANFFKTNYNKEMLEKELSVRGWNWGTVHFTGSVLSFDVENKTSFEIPLNHVSQCNTGKNEVTLEFHQNDDAPVSLMEMRYHIPTTESSDIDPVDSFYQNVINKASVISVSGDAIAIFREIHCLTPRGRYDIKIFQTFFQLHGKTFDYKIPIYHYLVLLFQMEEETSIELPFSEEDLKNKYEDKLTKDLSGPVYEVMGKIMKVCSFKAAAGYLYPLERGFIYVHKPPIHIRFEEISSVNFARSGGSTRSFDFEIELKSGTQHTFSSIEKEEYNKLFEFIVSKKIHVKNTGKNDKNTYKDDFSDSDNENEPDAYLARVKAEAKERDEEDDEGMSEEESTDEDFNPVEPESDVAEEYDSNAASDSTDSEAGSDASGDKKKKKKKKEKEKKREKKSSSSSKPRKKKERDDGKPKRAATAFMLWLNDHREEIKKDNPGIKVTEIAKKGGEMWNALKDKSVWEEKANKEKEKYNEAMKNYKAEGGSKKKDSDDKGTKRKKDSSPKKSTSMSGSGFKSKEYISDEDSSSESEEDKKKKTKKDKKTEDKDEKESSENESSAAEDSD
uniref:FACT complex subunit SSRP1 n=1 Tax=Phlebotomus papatasi TaxID=29031 RepID=A0A1B0D4W3_PHLPP